MEELMELRSLVQQGDMRSALTLIDELEEIVLKRAMQMLKDSI